MGTIEAYKFYESGELRLPKYIKACPMCKKTAIEKDASSIYCRYCEVHYSQMGGLLDYDWFDETGNKVTSVVDPIIDKIQSLADWEYQAKIYYLKQEEMTGMAEEHDSGCFNPVINHIFLSSELEGKQRLYSLAHEFGHSKDLHNNYNGDSARFEKTDVIEKEKTAWLYAVEVLHNYNFDQWEDFIDYAVSCLATYYLHYRGSTVDAYLAGLELVNKINELDVELWEWKTHHEHRKAREQK